jgi:hypothetical protein
MAPISGSTVLPKSRWKIVSRVALALQHDLEGPIHLAVDIRDNATSHS